jgi:alkylation response protein AidB-like acyl-CoA dehydrogenase
MAWDYIAPLRDMRFVIERVLEAPASWQACPAFAEVDTDTAGAVIGEAARFASQVLLPLNAVGDREGCRVDAEGRVKTPTGFRAAYQAFVEGGWPALPCAPEWGGQGLPLLLDAALREMLSACNHGWNMYPDLLHGAYETLKAHGSDELKSRYLARLVSGEHLAAMALTEPQAGSDLGQLRTRAELQPDGSLCVTGQKIFISGGDSDMADNVLHLVLCRLPDAPPGSKGISLALLPRVRPDGTRNAVFVDGLEHKMGIHGSATCAMRYEAASGWLVGEPNRGLAAMFLMMNSARLHVGLQGLGHQEMATQNAARHAAERVQGGRPIADHAAVRHLLLRSQARLEGQRVIAYRAALALDEAAHHADADQRAAAARLAALLTPVVKACCTEQGFESASRALQVFGGYGYVRETGIEQTLRDVRIAMVYEGTNEIQAIDLVQRKLLADGGATALTLLAMADEEALACLGESDLADLGEALAAQTRLARDGLARLAQAAAADRELPLQLAGDVMAGIEHLLLGWAFAASARAAGAEPDIAWAQAKIERMRYGMQWIVPQSAVHWQRVQAVASALPGAAVIAAAA